MSDLLMNPENADSETSLRGDAEKGYPIFFVHWHRAYLVNLGVSLLLLLAMGGSFIWYLIAGRDFWPGGLVGILYGCIGLLFLLLALGLYSLRRRLRLQHRKIGQLNAALNWHKSFGLLSLAALLMHSFGNFS